MTIFCYFCRMPIFSFLLWSCRSVSSVRWKSSFFLLTHLLAIRVFVDTLIAETKFCFETNNSVHPRINTTERSLLEKIDSRTLLLESCLMSSYFESSISDCTDASILYSLCGEQSSNYRSLATRQMVCQIIASFSAYHSAKFVILSSSL